MPHSTHATTHEPAGAWSRGEIIRGDPRWNEERGAARSYQIIRDHTRSAPAGESGSRRALLRWLNVNELRESTRLLAISLILKVSLLLTRRVDGVRTGGELLASP